MTVREIDRIMVGVKDPVTFAGHAPGGVFGWTYIRFRMRDGTEVSLPPNLSHGLRSRRWRGLRLLVEEIRKYTKVPVEGIDGPDQGIIPVSEEDLTKEWRRE